MFRANFTNFKESICGGQTKVFAVLIIENSAFIFNTTKQNNIFFVCTFSAMV